MCCQCKSEYPLPACKIGKNGFDPVSYSASSSQQCRLFVAFPRFAQKELNKSQLELRKQVISNPQADSIDLDIVTATLSNSSHHPTLDSFEADLFLENTLPDYKPFGRITIPSLRADHETLATINQTMKIIDMTQFINYCKMIMGSEEYRLALRGKVSLHQGSLPTAHLDFDKIITAKGQYLHGSITTCYNHHLSLDFVTNMSQA